MRASLTSLVSRRPVHLLTSLHFANKHNQSVSQAVNFAGFKHPGDINIDVTALGSDF